MSRFKYNEKDMENAIDAVKKGSPIATAAKNFNVPRTTLSDKVKGKTPLERKMGPPSILSQNEEKNLVKWIIHLGNRGFPVSSAQLLDSVQMLLKTLGKPNPLNNDRPGRHWLEAFQKRHSEISFRVSQNLTRTRASVSEISIRRWFDEITEYFTKNDLLEASQDPYRVYNCDETAFFLSPGNNRVLVQKGQKIVHNVINSEEKENITTLIMGNAAGELAPPMIVVNLKRIPKSLATSMPPSWAIGRSDNGWMTGQTFYEYISNVFYPWLIQRNVEFPIILYLDGHVSHLTLPLSEFCTNKKIEIVALYPNATHFLQPMDVSLFHPLKAAWKKAVYQWRIENAGIRLRRDNFALLLHKVLQETVKPSILQNGFRACGLVPLNPESIDYFKIKKQTNEKSSETAVLNPNENKDDNIQKHLNYIESFIPDDVLQLFKESGPTWLHEMRYTELFNIWYKTKLRVSSSTNSDKDKNQEEHIENYDMAEDLLKDLLPENQILDFIVTETGILQEATPEDPSGKLAEVEDIQDNVINEINQPENNCERQDMSRIKTGELDSTLENTVLIISDMHVNNYENVQEVDITRHSLDEKETKAIQSDENNLTEGSIKDLKHVQDVKDIVVSGKKEEVNICESISNHEEGHPLNSPSEETTPKTACLSPKLQNDVGSSKDFQVPNKDQSAIVLPEKKTDEKNIEADIPEDIPSPFKKNLFWPETPKPTKKNTEKIPSVATSREWQEYFRKKENKKIEKEKEIEDRKRKREENKKLVIKKMSGQLKIQKEKKKKLEEKNKAKENLPGETNEAQNESWFCVICEEDCQENMIRCQQCLLWMHERCANISKQIKKFVCQICITNNN